MEPQGVSALDRFPRADLRVCLRDEGVRPELYQVGSLERRIGEAACKAIARQVERFKGWAYSYSLGPPKFLVHEAQIELTLSIEVRIETEFNRGEIAETLRDLLELVIDLSRISLERVLSVVVFDGKTESEFTLPPKEIQICSSWDIDITSPD